MQDAVVGTSYAFERGTRGVMYQVSASSTWGRQVASFGRTFGVDTRIDTASILETPPRFPPTATPCSPLDATP